MVAVFQPETREFQGTIHLQTRTTASDSELAHREFHKIADILRDAGYDLDAFGVPLLRDMQEEGDDKPKKMTTVLVAFEVASPSDSTADCVSHEFAGAAMGESDLERKAENLTEAVARHRAYGRRYAHAVAGRIAVGDTGGAAYYTTATNEQRAAAEVAQRSLDDVNQRREGSYTQGKITDYRILGIEEGVAIGELVPAQAIPVR